MPEQTPLKVLKNVFFFILEVVFVLKIFQSLRYFFDNVEEAD